MLDGHRVFDFQNHIFPTACVELIERSNGPIGIRRDPDGELFLAQRGAKRGFNFLPKYLYADFERRTRLMDRFGVDVQILSFPAPGVDRFGEELSAELSRLINDEITRLSERYPDRVTGLASIPFSDVPEAVDEMRRAVKVGGLKGVEAYSNINGEYLDSPRFFPIYEQAESLHAPIFVHPTIPNVAPVVGPDHNMNLVYGWPFDTTISMTRLAFSDIPERFPRLRFIFAHGGGMVPFFAGRILTLNAAYGAALGGMTQGRRGFQRLKKMYVDLAVHHEPAVLCTMSFFSPARCVFASDYPYGQREGLELLELSLKTMKELDADEEDKEMMLAANAARLLRM